MDNTKDNTNKLNIKDNNYALEVLSYYLWGQSKAPAPAEIADEKFIRSTSADTTVQIDAREYMDKIVRPNFELGEVGIFQTFFSGATKFQRKNKERKHEEVLPRKITVSDLESIVKSRKGETDTTKEGYSLTHDEFVGLFYPKTEEERKKKTGISDETIDAANKAELPLYHYTSNSQSEDYWMRAFTFGSTKFELNKEKIRYVFDKNGNPLRLEKVYVKPMEDDFNFVSSTEVASGLNPLMEKMMDPSGIGRTVKFEFIDGNTSKKNENFYSLTSNGTYTAQDYQRYIKEISLMMSPTPEAGAIIYTNDNYKYMENHSAMLHGLKVLHSSNVYNYLDDKNKLVIFGTNSADHINNTVTAKKIDLNNILSLGGSAEAYLNTVESYWIEKYQKYIKNGIVYVAGNGNDTVTGTEYNDRLLGAAGDDTLKGGEGSDHMEGGTDFDTYHIEGDDTVFDSDGKGKIVFKDGQTAGSFERVKDQDGVWRSEGMEAIRQGNDLKVSADGGSATIQNFFRQASVAGNGSLSLLGITLADAVPTEENPDGGAINLVVQEGRHHSVYLAPGRRFHIRGGDQDNLIFGNAAQSAHIEGGRGSNRIFGSYGADVIEGGSASDYLVGSPFIRSSNPQQLAQDKDLIIGGGGRDIIAGMAGDDIIHTGLVNEHYYSGGSDEAGDLADGGPGDDTIYGSIDNDFLSGGEGADTLYGGAGDDVLLGDAHYRLSSRGTPVEQVEHRYENGKWRSSISNAATKSHKNMFGWESSINREQGDYQLTPPPAFPRSAGSTG